MVRKYKRREGSRNYRNYTSEQLATAVRAVKDGRMTQREASRSFKIPIGTLNNKIKRKHSSNPGHPKVFTDEEQAFVDHLTTVADWGFPFDMTDLRLLGSAYLNKQNREVKQFQNNVPSLYWARNFLERHPALRHRQCQNIKTVRAGVSVQIVKKYFDNLETTLKNPDGTPIPSSHIFNYDEKNLSDDPGTKRCIFRRGVKYPERVRDSTKSSTSIMFCGSADGQMLPAYVVYKAEHLWTTWTEGGPKNTHYNRSKSGWFDNHCFNDWFESVFVPHARKLPGQKVIIGDNLSSHFSTNALQLAAEHNIRFTCLPANSTHILQPLDVAFYGPLKKYWRRVLDDWKARAANKAQTVTKDAFPSLLKKVYLSLYPPDEERSQNLVSGFRTCGIHPLNADVVLKRLPDSKVNNTDIPATVSEVVLGMLKKMRGVDGQQQTKKRKKKLTVEPGKSISVEDLDQSIASCSTESSVTSEAGDDSAESEDDCESMDLDKDEGTFDDETEGATSEKEVIADTIEPSVGQYYVVKFQMKASVNFYLAKLLDHSEDECTMKFLRSSKKVNCKFVWPSIPDEGIVAVDQLVKQLSAPLEERRGGLVFPENELYKFKNIQ